MAGAPIIEIREPGRPVRRVIVDRAIEVGRECDGEVLSDEGVSRRHLKLMPSPVALSVVDDAGAPMFTLNEVGQLGAKNSAALDRIFQVAQRLSGMGAKAVEDAAKNSAPEASAVSSSG